MAHPVRVAEALCDEYEKLVKQRADIYQDMRASLAKLSQQERSAEDEAMAKSLVGIGLLFAGMPQRETIARSTDGSVEFYRDGPTNMPLMAAGFSQMVSAVRAAADRPSGYRFSRVGLKNKLTDQLAKNAEQLHDLRRIGLDAICKVWQ